MKNSVEGNRARNRRWKQTAKGSAYHKACRVAAREKLRKIIREGKDKPCMDCGQSYPYFVMHYDHRDPSEKKYTIARFGSRASAGPHTVQELLNEIAKCDVVCANCHALRHGSEDEEGCG